MRQEIEKKLKLYPKEYKVAFAARCAIKVQPFLLHFPDKYLFSILFAADVAVACDDDVIPRIIARIVNTAIRVTHTTAHTTRAAHTAAHSATSATHSVTSIATSAASYTAINIMLDLEIMADLDKMQQFNNANDYMFRPLYDNDIPSSYKEQIQQYKIKLKSIGFGFWIKVFQKYLDGKMTMQELKTRVLIPKSIIEQGGLEATKYIEKLYEQSASLNEVRVAVLGDGGAGKTSLVRKLFSENMKDDEKSTTEVNIRDLKIEDKNTTITTHIWDFGGQVIMHSTHKFFMSEQTVYIIVLDGRKESQPEYWLEHIKNYGGNSPILLVNNKIDENRKNALNLKELQSLFPKQNIINEVFEISCLTSAGIDNFTKLLNQEVVKLNEQLKFPAEWIGVKNELEEDVSDKMKQDDFIKVCENNNIKKEEDRESLLLLCPPLSRPF